MLALEHQINKSDTKTRTYLEQFVDYGYSWFDFTLRYNDALFEAMSKSVESFFNVYNAPVQKIRNTMRSSFDSTLRNRLNEENFASSLTNLVSSGARLADLTGYNIIRNSFSDFFSSESKLLEPLRDGIFYNCSKLIVATKLLPNFILFLRL